MLKGVEGPGSVFWYEDNDVKESHDKNLRKKELRTSEGVARLEKAP